MSDSIQPAPHAPQPVTTSAPTPVTAPTAEASNQNFSRPATSTTPQPIAPTAPTATPASVPSATTVPPPVSQATAPEPETLNEKLNAVDRYWKFKGVFQILIIIVGLVGIGAFAWCVSAAPSNEFYFYSYEIGSSWPGLITFAISIIYTFTCIAVLVTQKRPVHPGLRVAMDLLLWLGLAITGAVSIIIFLDIESWGLGGDIGFNDSQGSYELANNGTWVWQSSSSYYSASSRSCNLGRASGSTYYGFKSCAEQDGYINKLWQEKPKREQILLTGVVCQFIVLLLHFVLFVWACVDTYRRNHSKVSQDAEKLAANIVQTMIQNGAIIPPPSQAHMQPIPWGQPGHYQLRHGQMYPMAAPYPQQAPQGQPIPQQYYAPQMAEQRPMLPPRPVVAGPSNEKSEGPRYA